MSWFVTKRGRLFTRAIVFTAASSVFSIQVAFHGPLLDTYQSIAQMYKNGRPKAVDPDVLKTADLVLNDCGLSEKEKKKVKFFNVIGHDLFHAGGTNSWWTGAIIGLPFMFGVQKLSDIDTHEMKIQGRDQINWVAEGEQLFQSLILSEQAQKFAIAREVLSCDVKNVFLNAAIAALLVIAPARFVKSINDKHTTGLAVISIRRATFYFAAYAVSFLFYRCLKDPKKHLLDKKCDKMAAELGTQYLEGGIEFYEKALSKNKALRELMGSKGEKIYEENGNNYSILFVPMLPLTKRLENLLDLKKELCATK